MAFGPVSGAVLCAALLVPIPDIAAADGHALPIEQFTDAMSRCLDWIEAGAPDTVPFADWEAVSAFPVGRPAGSIASGNYQAPGYNFSVSLIRGGGRVMCVGQEGGPAGAESESVLADWLPQEIARGRLAGPVQVAGFNYPLAVCVGDTGGLDVIRDDTDALFFSIRNGLPRARARGNLRCLRI